MLIILGVYKITNTVNNKIYIGESNDIERRWEEHKDNLNNNSHHSYKLQKDWNTYGKENFSFEVLEEIQKLKSPYKTTMQLIYLEGTYITQYNSIDNGYNVENTLEEIISGRKIIMSKKADPQYLSNLIKNNGVPKEKKKKEKSIKIKDKSKLKIKKESNLKNCIEIYEELLNEGYLLDFSKTAIYNILKEKELLIKQNNSFYINDIYLNQEYFVNGKEAKNKYGYIYNQILVTEKGKNLIIEILSLHKQKNNEEESCPANYAGRIV